MSFVYICPRERRGLQECRIAFQRSKDGCRTNDTHYFRRHGTQIPDYDAVNVSHATGSWLASFSMFVISVCNNES